jgi:hypothetical protein
VPSCFTCFTLTRNLDQRPHKKSKKTRNQASVPRSANPWTLSSSGPSTSHVAGPFSASVAQVGAPDEFDMYFGPGDMSGADAAEMDRLEREVLNGVQFTLWNMFGVNGPWSRRNSMPYGSSSTGRNPWHFIHSEFTQASSTSIKFP